MDMLNRCRKTEKEQNRSDLNVPWRQLDVLFDGGRICCD